MAKATAVMRRFGAFLEGERLKHHGWSLSRVAGKLARMTPALEPFDGAQLYRYEKGEVERPDPLVLFHLAAVYGVDFQLLIRFLQEDRELAEDAKQRMPARKVANGEHPPPGSKSARGRRAAS